MNALLEDRRLLLPTVVTALVIAIGASLIILLAGDATGGGSSASATPRSAPAGGAPAGGSGATVRVSIKDFLFDPEVLTVKAGTEVEWTNEDSAPHNAIGDAVETKDLEKGERDSVKFQRAGTYDYVCTFHAFMKGKVVVQ